MAISRIVERPWSCPNCSSKFAAEVHEIVDASDNPAAYTSIFDDTFNNLTCPAGHVMYTVLPVLVHVPELKTLVFFVPSGLPVEEQNAEADRLMDSFLKRVPRFERYMGELGMLCPNHPSGYSMLRAFLQRQEESRPVARAAPAGVSDVERRLSTLTCAAASEPDPSRRLDMWRQLSAETEGTNFSALRGMAASGIGASLMKLATRDSAGDGERRRLLVLARESLAEAVDLFDPSVYPEQWAIARMNLAATLGLLGDDSWDTFMAQVEQYLLVIMRLQREAAPDERGLALKRLRELVAAWLSCKSGPTLEADVYEALNSISRDVVRVLDDAVEREELINWLYLRGLTCSSAPPQYVSAGDDAESAHTQQLQLLQREEDPEFWAVTQQNLGAAQNRATHDQPETRYRRAVRAFEACLEVYTKVAFPVKHEENSRNLGRAAFLLGKHLVASSAASDVAARFEGQKALNLACTQFAAYGPDNEFVLAATALGDLARRLPGDRHEHNERALHLYLMALSKIDKETDAQSWASLTFRLGVAQAARIHMDVGHFRHVLFEDSLEQPDITYLSVGGGLNEQSNLAAAAESFERALSVLTKDAYPKEWALASSYLATVKLESAQVEKVAEMKEAGIQLLEEVFEFLQPLPYRDVLHDVQLSLAAHHGERARGDRRENLTKSIRLYRSMVQDGVPLKVTDRLNYQRWLLALLEFGDGDVLDELCEQARRVTDDASATPHERREAFYRWAKACEIGGAREDALAHWESAIGCADQLLAESETTASRNLANDAVFLYRAAIGCLVNHEEAIPDAHLQRAFLLAGRMHSILLDASLAFAPAAPPPEIPERLAARERELLNAYRREWAAVDEFERTDDRINAVNRMGAARRALEACWRDMEACPGGAPYVRRRRNQSIEWGDVAAWLAGTEGPTAFVEFVCLEKTLIALIARSAADRPALYRWPLSDEDLRECADRFNKRFAELDPYDDIPESSWLEELNPVARTLHDAVGADTRLFVLPDGPLHGLPLHSIGIDGAPLLAHHVVVYVSSLADAVRHPPAPERRGPRRRFLESCYKRVLVAGDPTGDLPHAADEARAVAKALGVRELLGKSVTKSGLIEALKDRELVHFAGHAEFRVFAPMNAGLVLSGGEYLSASDMLVESFGCDLLVLASCSSAQQSRSSRGNPMGLPQVCLSAGVGRILCAQWPVEDVVARRFMHTFYARLHQRGDAGDAVRVAALELVKEGLHPYSWAPFVLYGRPQARVSSI